MSQKDEEAVLEFGALCELLEVPMSDHIGRDNYNGMPTIRIMGTIIQLDMGEFPLVNFTDEFREHLNKLGFDYTDWKDGYGRIRI